MILLVAAALVACAALAAALLGGNAPAREGARRLQAVRVRHADSARDKVEAQLRKAVAARHPGARERADAGSGRRLHALMQRLHRTGRGWSVGQYATASVALGGGIALLVLVKSGAPLLALAVGVLAGAALPHHAVGHLVARRVAAFIARFPDAIELLVRGLRAGLPVTETLALVSAELPGPVGEEFKLVSERIRIGKPMDDALQDSADRLALSEFNFFCIALAIQRETGGNLAETLSNLADVLRKRAQMKLKIKAMSSESKASALIVGSLPFIVFALVWWINPQYLAGFFTDQRLMITGLGGLTWMGLGAFIMAKMVNFEI